VFRRYSSKSCVKHTLNELSKKKINVRQIDSRRLGVAFDETVTDADLVDLISCFIPDG